MRPVRCEGGLCDGMDVPIEDWVGEGTEFFCPPQDAVAQPGDENQLPRGLTSKYRIVGDLAVCIEE